MESSQTIHSGFLDSDLKILEFCNTSGYLTRYWKINPLESYLQIEFSLYETTTDTTWSGTFDMNFERTCFWNFSGTFKNRFQEKDMDLSKSFALLKIFHKVPEEISITKACKS